MRLFVRGRTSRRSRPASASQTLTNHALSARRLGSTLAPGTNKDSHRAASAESPKRSNQGTRAANNSNHSTGMPAEGVFQFGQVASEELNAISEPNLAFRTQNNEECGPSGTSPGTYADRKTLLDRFVEANCGNEEKKRKS